jgi:hypothetical protein
MLVPDLPPSQPPRITAAVELHHLRPAQDLTPVIEFVNDGLDALYRMRSSALVSVLATHSGSTAASVLAQQGEPATSPGEGGEALAKAVEVVTESLGAPRLG